MLTRADDARATEIATYLEQQNRARQTIEKQILQQAIDQITQNGYDKDGHCAIVCAADGWHPGVIGIVASRIVDRYHRPAVMVALNKNAGARTLALERFDAFLQGHGARDALTGKPVALGASITLPASSATLLEIE